MSDINLNHQKVDTTSNVAQQSIEENYLDCLLQPMEGFSSQEQEQPISKQSSSVVVTAEPEPEPVVVTAEPEPEPVNVQQETEEHLEPFIIDYSYDREIPFACQLFSLAGLKLAIPLSSFSLVFDKPTIEPSASQLWLLDRIQHNNNQLDLIDLGGLMFNRPYHDASHAAARYSYNNIILLPDGKTSLPCEAVLDIVTINPEKVCWRSLDSQRVWLAGTLKEEGYVLLDLDGIMQLIKAN